MLDFRAWRCWLRTAMGGRVDLGATWAWMHGDSSPMAHMKYGATSGRVGSVVDLQDIRASRACICYAEVNVIVTGEARDGDMAAKPPSVVCALATSRCKWFEQRDEVQGAFCGDGILHCDCT
jgi:hypothetical protein